MRLYKNKEKNLFVRSRSSEVQTFTSDSQQQSKTEAGTSKIIKYSNWDNKTG